MSYPTKPTFIAQSEGWEPSQAHPCMQWMKEFTRAWDARQVNEQNVDEWHTDDYSYQKASGEVIHGKKDALKAALEVYAPFASYLHEPVGLLAVWESDDGWTMMGQATLFADLPVPGGEKTKKDLTGKSWDLAIPAMFQFIYVKVSGASNGGIRMKSNKVFSDSAPAVVEMIKRGMLKPEQLLG